MPTDVIMPQMGESIAEGTIVKWLKQVGDQVQRDEPLFEISTDKVDAEIPAPASGVLLEILHHEGETVSVNAVVARIGETSEATAAAATTQVTAPAVPTREEPVRVTMQREMEAPPVATSPPPPAAAPPLAKAAPPSEAKTVPTSGDGAPSKEELRRTRSSPLVRNIAAEHGIDLAEVPGTGLSGRVTKQDILRYIEQRGAKPRPAAAPQVVTAAPTPVTPPAPAPAPVPAAAPPAPAPTPAAPPAPAFAPGERVRIEPMSIMRRKIAEHMVLSRRTSAHVSTFFEVDYTNIARLRERIKKNFEERNGVKLTYLPFIIKATIDALKVFPILNSSVDGENIIYKQDINIGLAVALDWGLIVPVIKRADELSMLGLARAAQDLATRARNKQLKPDEVTGGTFTITNPGLYGGLIGTPIINQPQVAIMGVGSIAKRPWVIETAEGDALAIRTIGMLSLSFDHRVIDGAVADQFMAHVKKTLETTDFSTLI